MLMLMTTDRGDRAEESHKLNLAGEIVLDAKIPGKYRPRDVTPKSEKTYVHKRGT